MFELGSSNCAAFMPRIRTGRSLTVESLCDFSEAEQMQKEVTFCCIFFHL